MQSLVAASRRARSAATAVTAAALRASAPLPLPLLRTATAAFSTSQRCLQAASPSSPPAAAAPVAAAPLSETMLDDARYILGTYARQPLELVRGEGVFVWDAQGRRYMDFHSGIAVNSIGHAHPAWVAALQAQSTQLAHVSNLFYTRPQVALAKSLLQLSQGRFDKVFFCNSGTEANEAAIKFVRKYQLVAHQKRAASAGADSAKKRPEDNASVPHEKMELLAFEHGFHGRSMGSLSLTSKWAYRGPFTPLVPFARFQAYNDATALESGINARTAGVFVEPLQGEGGVHPARPEFLRAVREQCTKHDALMVVDEVQCGLSRTGAPFAHQHSVFSSAEAGGNIEPDIMTLAKPLAGGLPIGAVLLKQKVADCLIPGDHGSTFSGGPLICSAAQAVVDVLSSPSLLANVSARSEQLQAGLRAIQAARKQKATGVQVVDVRGLGLLVGMELSIPVADVVSAASARGLMLISAGDRVLRLCPPLIIEQQHIEWAVGIIEQAINDAEAKMQSAKA